MSFSRPTKCLIGLLAGVGVLVMAGAWQWQWSFRDSVEVIEVRPLGEGVEWRRVRFGDSGRSFDITAIRCAPRRLHARLLDLRGSARGADEPTLPHGVDCVTINGGYFDSQFRPTGLLRVDGREISSLTTRSPLSAVLAIDAQQQVLILRVDDPRVALAVSARQCGPFLIDPGSTVGIRSDAGITAERSAIAVADDGSILLVKTGSATLLELATCFSKHSAAFGVASIERAMNLDGGPSCGRTIDLPAMSADEQPRGAIRDAVVFEIK